MSRRAAVFASVVVLASVMAGVSSGSAGYDRSPVHVSGLKPDTWAMPTTTGESDLKSRYPGITADYCVGVIMTQDPADSSFVHGLTRYWDKLACAGRTSSTGSALFAVVVDAKSATGWVIYRLKGVTIAALRG